MSWNAAKRAMTLGYTHVVWYPEGSDGWIGHGLPTEPRGSAGCQRPSGCDRNDHSSSCWISFARREQSLLDLARCITGIADGLAAILKNLSLPRHFLGHLLDRVRVGLQHCSAAPATSRCRIAFRRRVAFAGRRTCPGRPSRCLVPLSTQYTAQPAASAVPAVFCSPACSCKVVDHGASLIQWLPPRRQLLTPGRRPAWIVLPRHCCGSTGGPDHTEASDSVRHLDLLTRPVGITRSGRCAHRQCLPHRQCTTSAGSINPVPHGGTPGRAPDHRRESPRR